MGIPDILTRTKVQGPEICRSCGVLLGKREKAFLVSRIKIQNRFVYICIPCGSLTEDDHKRQFEELLEKYDGNL